MMMNGTYRVYEFPTESPVHGPHVMVNNPAIPAASPFGWHDVDGVEGAEFTITRGNNVHAYQDIDDDQLSSNDEPDGGEELIFDFAHDVDAEPNESIEADVTNLFYANNLVHDITYLLGFDEASGNYQSNNYGNGGAGNDNVIAHALDGSGTNNANFGLSTDGNNGNMNMFRCCLLYTSPSPRDATLSRMPSSA